MNDLFIMPENINVVSICRAF